MTDTQRKLFMGLPVFEPLKPEDTYPPECGQYVDPCPACAESVDGLPGNGACQQCAEESNHG